MEQSSNPKSDRTSSFKKRNWQFSSMVVSGTVVRSAIEIQKAGKSFGQQKF